MRQLILSLALALALPVAASAWAQPAPGGSAPDQVPDLQLIPPPGLGAEPPKGPPDPQATPPGQRPQNQQARPARPPPKAPETDEQLLAKLAKAADQRAARPIERELKVKFDWREADKNLEKEERNKPLDLNALPAAHASGIDGLLALETRSWRSESAGQSSAPENGRPSFRGRRKGPAGRPQGQSHGSRGNSAHPGRNASHPRGGNSGSRPTRGNRGR